MQEPPGGQGKAGRAGQGARGLRREPGEGTGPEWQQWAAGCGLCVRPKVEPTGCAGWNVEYERQEPETRQMFDLNRWEAGLEEGEQGEQADLSGSCCDIQAGGRWLVQGRAQRTEEGY